MISKNEMKRMARMYGNGAVYATDGKRVFEFLATNFSVERMHATGMMDFDVRDTETVIGFGYGTTKAEAIRALNVIKARINAIEDANFNPPEGDPKEVAKRNILDCWSTK